MAEKGLYVLPCAPGDKVPIGRLVPHGFRNASNNPATVDRWWHQAPAMNIGLVTGQVNGLAVVDVDHDAKAEEDDYPTTWNQTMVVNTPHGAHLYHVIDGPQRSYNEVAGIGIKADGGYVIAPPSFVDLDYYVLRERPLASLPAAWLDRFRREKVMERQPPKVRERLEERGYGKPVRILCSTRMWADAALRYEVAYVERAQVGERQVQLNVAAFILGQITATGWLSEEQVYVGLSRAARAVGLEDKEAMSTIRCGLNAGSYFPRHFA